MLNPARGSRGWLPETLFGRVDPNMAEELAELGSARTFRSGHKILTQGDSTCHVVLLLRGIVKVTAVTGNGRTVLLAIRVAGDIVGELSVSGGGPRTATVTACAEVRAREVAAPVWDAFLDRNPAVTRSVSQVMSDRLRAETLRRIAFSEYQAPVRIARVLAEFGQTYGHDTRRGRELPFNLSQQELAAAAECSIATVQSTLRDLRSKRLADQGYRNVVILDLDALDLYVGPAASS